MPKMRPMDRPVPVTQMLLYQPAVEANFPFAAVSLTNDTGALNSDGITQDASLAEQIAELLGVPEVDSAVDAVGFEARGHGHDGAQREAPATVLNALMEVTRAAGKIGIPGLYVTDDPGASDAASTSGAPNAASASEA